MLTPAPKAWLNKGLPGCKPGWTNQTYLAFKPGLPDFTICAKSLVNQDIPGKPGYPKNQENQTLSKVLNEPGLPEFTICAKSLVNQGIPGKSGKPGYSKNQNNQT